MDDALRTELYREEGKDSRYVRLSVAAEGGAGIYTQDVGEHPKRFGRDEDYEFSVRPKFASWSSPCCAIGMSVDLARLMNSVASARRKAYSTPLGPNSAWP